jgi:hypothetical protein
MPLATLPLARHSCGWRSWHPTFSGFHHDKECCFVIAPSRGKFITNRDLPPTDNGSEQALRPCVTYRKVTNGFRCQWGARLYADIRLTLDGQPLPATAYQPPEAAPATWHR